MWILWDLMFVCYLVAKVIPETFLVHRCTLVAKVIPETFLVQRCIWLRKSSLKLSWYLVVKVIPETFLMQRGIWLRKSSLKLSWCKDALGYLGYPWISWLWTMVDLDCLCTYYYPCFHSFSIIRFYSALLMVCSFLFFYKLIRAGDRREWRAWGTRGISWSHWA